MSALNITFFSDTNLMYAKDELELLQLDTLEQDGSSLRINSEEYRAMEEPIQAIIDAWGGSVD